MHRIVILLVRCELRQNGCLCLIWYRLIGCPDEIWRPLQSQITRGEEVSDQWINYSQIKCWFIFHLLSILPICKKNYLPPVVYHFCNSFDSMIESPLVLLGRRKCSVSSWVTNVCMSFKFTWNMHCKIHVWQFQVSHLKYAKMRNHQEQSLTLIYLLLSDVTKIRK